MSSLPPVITTMSTMLTPLCTPAGVGQFVTNALAGQIPETQISEVCGGIVRAYDGYVDGHPQRGPGISLRQAAQRFADSASRSEAAPEITGNAAAIANLVSAFLAVNNRSPMDPPSLLVGPSYLPDLPFGFPQRPARHGLWSRVKGILGI